MERIFLIGFLTALAGAAETPAPIGQLTTPGWRYEEIRRFEVPEAGQGVAVDRDHFYAINNRTIAKYRKDSGERLAVWEDAADGEIIHLNAGRVFDGRLHAVHSNYPGVPMLSSVEIFETATLRHVGSHSLGRMDGSLTWLDRRGDRWIACFVHYLNRGAEPGRDNSWTQIIALDDGWRRTGGWALPPELIARFGERGYSASGGSFGPGGHLYLTGHDNPELYVLDFPGAGSVMKWIATVPFPSEGQAFCWDPGEAGVVYSILRRTRQIIVGRVLTP